jgi:hypothetical protein
MDSTVENAASEGPLTEFPAQNTLTSDVEVPKFFLLYTPQPEQVRSFLSQSRYKELDDTYHDLEGAAGSRILREVSQAINPSNGIIKTSTLKYTPDYHDLKLVDASLNLIPVGAQVLLFTPYSRQLFVEKNCLINMILLGSNVEILTNGTLRLASGGNTPHEVFYLDAVNRQLVDNFVPLQFLPPLEYLEADRKVLDDYFQDPQRKVAVIVHEEDSYGRTGVNHVKDFVYDTQFYEAAIGGLSYLAPGGTMILKAVSLGSRALADLIYLYKYLFGSLSIVKPSTSHVLSQEHYIIARGFNVERFTQQRVTLYKFLNRLASDSGKARVTLWSFISNINTSTAVPINPSALEFVRWLISRNDEIALWIVANSIMTRRAIEDRNADFPEATPLLTVDHVTFRQAAGQVGRINNFLTVPAVFSETIKDESADSENNRHLTATGQIQSDGIRLEPISTALSRNFALFLSLNDTIDQLVSSPAFASLLPTLGSTTGEVRVSSEILYRARQQLKYNLREWLGNVYALGDIETIINLGGNTVDKKSIQDLLMSRRWSIQEMFNVSIPPTSPLASVTPDQLSQFLTIVFTNLNHAFKAIIANGTVNQIPVRITPLQNLRFRVSYVNEGVAAALMNRQNPSVVGEYELLNCLTEPELRQFDDVRKIVSLVADEKFQFRVAEHLCLPVLFSGFKNNLAVPDFYFEQQPELEFFASAVNRHAPLWCSAVPSDVKLGSQGDFFGPISQADHPVYRDNQVKLAVAFPPFHPILIDRVFARCLDLYQALLDVQTTDDAKQNLDFAVVLIFPNMAHYNDILAINLGPRMIATELLSETIIHQAYDPFTGVTYPNVNLKAFAIRTPGSAFTLST